MDFLDTTVRRNPRLIEAAYDLFASGKIHQDTYVLDLDVIRTNSRSISRAAKESGLKIYFEAKQFGRNPPACAEVVRSGMEQAVAIDMEEAKSLHRVGVKVGHVGHLGQVPAGEAEYILDSISPEVVTVYNFEKAAQISRAARKLGKKQKVLLKVIGENDLTYTTLGGGVLESELVPMARRIRSLPGVIVSGVTTYPALRYNLRSGRVEPTPNLETLLRCAGKLKEAGFEIEQVNAAGLSSTSTMSLLKEMGATHAEPGQALIGMTPLHAFSDEVELPGMVYVTEVDHVRGGKGFAYASGFIANQTIGVWNPLTYEYLYALAGESKKGLLHSRVILEPPVLPGSDPTFFMYLTLRETTGTRLKVGQTVITGCRGQVYRANSVKVAAVEGVQRGKPRLRGIYDRNGIRLAGPLDAPRA